MCVAGGQPYLSHGSSLCWRRSGDDGRRPSRRVEDHVLRVGASKLTCGSSTLRLWQVGRSALPLRAAHSLWLHGVCAAVAKTKVEPSLED